MDDPASTTALHGEWPTVNLRNERECGFSAWPCLSSTTMSIKRITHAQSLRPVLIRLRRLHRRGLPVRSPRRLAPARAGPLRLLDHHRRGIVLPLRRSNLSSTTVTLRCSPLRRASKGDGPAASGPFILRGSACDAFASQASHLRMTGLNGLCAASTPSLRAQRSNPESLRGKILDCFAALAMTGDRAFALRSHSLRTNCPDPPASPHASAPPWHPLPQPPSAEPPHA